MAFLEAHNLRLRNTYLLNGHVPVSDRGALKEVEVLGSQGLGYRGLAACFLPFPVTALMKETWELSFPLSAATGKEGPFPACIPFPSLTGCGQLGRLSLSNPCSGFLAEPPEVTVELSQLVIPWGQSAKLTCEVRGNPPPSVLWLRNAVPLTSSQRLRLSRRALRVVSVGPEDEGVYQCMAENEVGSAHAVVQLRTARPSECTTRAGS